MDSSFYYHSLYDASMYLLPLLILIIFLKSGLVKKAFGEKRAKHIKRVIFSVLILFILYGGYLFYRDDDLNPEIVKLLEEYSSNITKQQNGSVYHMGMWSSLDSSPYEVGLWRIEQYENSIINTGLPSTSIEFEDYPEEDWIEDLFPENEKPKWLCDYDKTGCLDSIYNQSEQAIYLGDNFQKHIDRYDGVFDYTNFGLFQQPSIYAPMMMFGPGIDVLKIKLILSLHNYKLGYRGAVVEELVQLLNHHKSVLDQTPYTVSKVISVVELQHIYKAAAYLMSKTNNENLSIWMPYIDALSQLENDQLTFNKPFNHEFVSSYNSFQIAGLGQFRKDLPSILKYLPKSFLYKPNRTANLMFKGLTVKRGQYEVSGDRIIVHKKPNIDDAIKFDLSNAIGSLLAFTVTPKFVDLDGAMHDLEVLQRLTKHLYRQSVNNGDIYFLSPYTGIEGVIKGNFYCIDANPKNEKPICLSVI